MPNVSNGMCYHFRYYNWATAAPQILSLVAFHKYLPEVRSDDQGKCGVLVPVLKIRNNATC